MVKQRVDLGAYRQVDLGAKVESASPHRLIQMLFEEILSQLRIAQCAHDGGESLTKNSALQKSITLIDGLRDALSEKSDTELPYALDNLYEYMQRQLTRARIQESDTLLHEVTSLVETVKEGWDAIGE